MRRPRRAPSFHHERCCPADCLYWRSSGMRPNSYLLSGAANSRDSPTTQSLCSEVSGTGNPRAALTRRNAVSGSTPDKTRRLAATRPDLPIPWRQWIATFFPAVRALSSLPRSFCAVANESGTPRSGIGNSQNCSPCIRLRSASRPKSKFFSSSLVRSDTTTSKPPTCQATTSSSSHSPPRGRGTMASLPRQGPSI
jgi:hypothetical protein